MSLEMKLNPIAIFVGIYIVCTRGKYNGIFPAPLECEVGGGVQQFLMPVEADVYFFTFSVFVFLSSMLHFLRHKI